MKPEFLRNIGILAHIDAGKTTVSERFLFYTGVERRLGEVHEGTAVMDWMPEERERGITITAAVTRCPWQDHLIQLIDTPGHVDFTAEVARSLRVLDAAVVVLDGVAGPQTQTETVVRQARRQQLPLLLFVNKMDRPGADFDKALRRSAERLHPGVVAVQLPWGEGRELMGVIDLLRMRLLTWSEEDQGKTVQQQDIPESERGRATAARVALCSKVADQREEWADMFLETDDLPDSVLCEALRLGTVQRRLVPALCGSALRNLGMQPLLDAVVSWFPSPLERPVPEAVVPKTGVTMELPPDAEAPLAALCFKVVHEAHGDLVYLRVFAGTLHGGDALVNVRTGRREKLQTLYAMHAEHREKLDSAGPGVLLAVPGLPRVQTSDTLCAAARPLLLAPITFPQPVLKQALEARDAADLGRLGQALAILVREDPTLRVVEDEDTGGYLLAGMGELHLEIAVHRLQRDFHLQVRAGLPRVSYRETLASAVRSRAELTVPGEEGTRVEVFLCLEPRSEEPPGLLLPPSCPALPAHILHALQQPALLQGWVGREGYPIAKLRILLEDWSTGSERVPTLEMLLGAIQLAVGKAFAAGSQVLEPRMALEVQVPEGFLSGVLADLQQRHAQIQEVEADADGCTISAQVPLSRMATYSTNLHSLSQGTATFHMVPEGLVPRLEHRSPG